MKPYSIFTSHLSKNCSANEIKDDQTLNPMTLPSSTNTFSIKSAFFYCCSGNAEKQAPYHHPLVCLAEGFRALGIPFYANVNYWRLTPDADAYLFQHDPDVTPDDCSVVILDHDWFTQKNPIPENLFHSQRQYITVYMDHGDGVLTISWRPEFRKFDFIFRAHFNSGLYYPDNMLPWAFGLSDRMLQEVTHPQAFTARRRALLINFRNVVDHPLRQIVADNFLLYIDKILPLDYTVEGFKHTLSDYHALQWQQTGHRHYPDYFKRLQSTVASACFGGYLQIQKQTGELIVPWWDSWRLWESLSAGCVPFHVDLQQYGAVLPEMPQNWQHYIGIDLDNFEKVGDRILQEPDLLPRISEAGRAWAIEHYSPVPTAHRFLSTLQAGQAATFSTSNFTTHIPSDQPDSQPAAFSPISAQATATEREKTQPTIVIDAVFFQLYKTGIARVWFALLQEWAKTSFAPHVVVLDRAGTAPHVPGLHYSFVPRYDYNTIEADRQMVQDICDEVGADLFISTYYTSALATPSAFMAYDMIPEVLGDLDRPMWQDKHYAIRHACAWLSISASTARDLVKFFPEVPLEAITVAYCGIDSTFTPARADAVQRFKAKYGISKPYFMLSGGRNGHKNGMLFFKAFSQLVNRQGFDIVCTGSMTQLEAEFRAYTTGTTVYLLHLNDQELRAAYSGAVALVYPSLYEGFGLPIAEAMSCGCPVITCANSSIPEVAGEAVMYVDSHNVFMMVNALCDVQKPEVRYPLVAAGLEQARNFSWAKMAAEVQTALVKATLLPLDLSETNLILFPDWFQPEAALFQELTEVLQTLAELPECGQITLLIDINGMTEEDVSLFLSSVTMNLMLEVEVDLTIGPKISFLETLGDLQWDVLLPQLRAKLSLQNEQQHSPDQLRVNNLPHLNLAEFIALR